MTTARDTATPDTGNRAGEPAGGNRAGEPAGGEAISRFAPGDRVGVLTPVPLPRSGRLDYLVPPGLHLRPGDLVAVPLGGRQVDGCVWGPGDDAAVPADKLRCVLARHDAPPLPAVTRRFVDWVSGYCLSAPGAVLRMAMSVPAALEPARPLTAYRPADPPPDAPGKALTATRRRVLALLADRPPDTAAAIAQAAGCGTGVIRQMAELGLLEAVDLPGDPPLPVPDPHRAGPLLTEAQAQAATEIADRARGGGFSVTLLDGVTGSGKTEVYFEAVAAALAAGGQVLVLLPEIALTGQWLDRFARRFAAPPTAWHSEVSSARRRQAWRAVAEGRARVVVGARSALFLPFADLRLIVVDEEHESAFKQEDGVLYHARDMAVVRGQLGGIAVVLASATPSLETLTNVEAGRYGRVVLPQRHGGASMPAVAAVDLIRDRPAVGQYLAPPLVRAVAETLDAGEQAMLFLNRRGYAPLTVCRSCGERIACNDCDAWMVDHRLLGRLVCHHCGATRPRPRICPACGEADSLIACGPGVERIAEEVDRVLPAARWLIVTSDTVAGPAQAEALMREVAAGTVDVLIGTQLLAKGHHFPKLTLVGVVDADLGLAGGDLRAAERTFQLLHQVAGRAGREDRPGRVLLQTHDPSTPVIDALVAGDRDGFLAVEAAGRRLGGWPPYGRLAGIVVSAADAQTADRLAADLARRAPSQDGITVLGPAPAPFAVLRGRHRRRLLVKAGRRSPLHAYLRDWLSPVATPGSARITVDVDPYSFV